MLKTLFLHIEEKEHEILLKNSQRIRQKEIRKKCIEGKPPLFFMNSFYFIDYS